MKEDSSLRGTNIWIDLLSDYLQSLHDELGLTFWVGAEIEFMLRSKGSNLSGSVLQKLIHRLHDSPFDDCKLQSEVYPNQFEVCIQESSDIMGLAERILKLKLTIDEFAADLSAQAMFAAKPISNAPGNGLHFHIHIENDEGDRLFSTNSKLLEFAIQGLCMTMNEAMVFFACCSSAYDRISRQTTDSEYRYACAPQSVSWGFNNRTCALRIPATSGTKSSTRIEHRLPSACCSPYGCLAAIIAGIGIGLRNKFELSYPCTQSDARCWEPGVELISRSHRQSVQHYLRCRRLHCEIFAGQREKYIESIFASFDFDRLSAIKRCDGFHY